MLCYRIEPKDAEISDYPYGLKETFMVTFTAKTSHFSVQVVGLASGIRASIPSVYSIILNYVNVCKEKNLRYLDYPTEKPEERAAETSPIDKYAVEVVEDTEKNSPSLDESCGRRKVVHTELIVHGQPTKSGDWPWHVAILRIDKSSLRYICGGTLMSKTLVLTGKLSSIFCCFKNLVKFMNLASARVFVRALYILQRLLIIYVSRRDILFCNRFSTSSDSLFET